MSEKITFVYKNQLDTESFIHMLDDVTECYKFYWLSALLSLFLRGKTEILFNEIIDKMIADAWYSVVEYHLHLGPKNTDGVVMNSLERAVLRLEKLSECGNMASDEEILAAIAEYDKDEEIKEAIEKVTKEFSGNGRVLIRTSGTEPLVRVMIEGEDQELITKKARELADLIESKLK